MVGSPIVQSFACKPVGLLHHYLEFHLCSMGDYNEEILTESMLFGLGCGLSFNFDRFAPDVIRMNCINDWLFKDLFGHINIKAWYKTEPNPANFILYINRLLMQGQPIITLCNLGDAKKISIQPILITEYDTETLLYCIKKSTNDDVERITVSQLVEWCDFKALNIAVNNFWFEIALPRKLFPIEKSVKWALLKNTQTMLYMPNTNCGIAGLKSFKTFVTELSDSQNHKEVVRCVDYFRTSISDTNGGSNRHLFANFLTQANMLLNIDSMVDVVEDFKCSATIWEELILDFEAIEKENTGKFRSILENVNEKINRIIDLEENSFHMLEKMICNKPIIHN